MASDPDEFRFSSPEQRAKIEADFDEFFEANAEPIPGHLHHTPESGEMFITMTGKEYRWDGTHMVQVGTFMDLDVDEDTATISGDVFRSQDDLIRDVAEITHAVERIAKEPCHECNAVGLALNILAKHDPQAYQRVTGMESPVEDGHHIRIPPTTGA